MFNQNKASLSVVLLALGLSIFLMSFTDKRKPILYIIGDSTVRNSNQAQWGWGTLISNYFDSSKIIISNNAMAGRSTRTFIKEGRWDKILHELKKGDFLMIQFGHNEGSKPDTGKSGYRGVLKGVTNDSVLLTWKDSTKETVYSYGWYLRKFIRESKEKGAIPIVLSMIPRNEFKNGKVLRANNDYGKWAKESANIEKAFFIDLNSITADKYDKLGAEETKKLFSGDHTHTNKEGANINAQSVIQGLKLQKNISLNNFLIK